jgi:hypothetical protein
MSYPINYPTPQGANVQIFQAPVRPVTTAWTAEWVKPQGASFVWFTLIGAGGGGGVTDGSFDGGGGGSGVVTNCMVPAFLIPDVLQVRVGTGGLGGVGIDGTGTAGTATTLYYQQKAGTGYTLLTAGAGGGGGAASPAIATAASTANYFAAAGFFQSVSGASGNNVAPATTFLSGGASASGSTDATNYGYFVDPSLGSANGFFQMQPIIVGAGGKYSAVTTPQLSGKGGIGCGGAGVPTVTAITVAGAGGDGLAVIVTW